jgi:diguanylate cyclase (GGDEF)-like protein
MIAVAMRWTGLRASVSSRFERDMTTQDRAATAALRLQATAQRQATAERRDEVARVRDLTAGSRRFDRPLILAMIDIDGLKAVNDTEGHAGGDALLRDVVAAMTATMRAYDVIVRWGGDEFVCVLSGTTLHVATERIARIQDALNTRRDGAPISVGLAQLNDDDSFESLIDRADNALYDAKTTRDT